MPTVLQIEGFHVVIYYNDHHPAHVHVLKADGEMRVALGDTTHAPTPLDIVNMKTKDVKKGLVLIATHQEFLIAKWREIHG